MQVKQVNTNNIHFKGILNNKILLKSLEKVSEHGTSFAAGTSLFMSLAVRPLAILCTPDTEKENKQYAVSNSICSGLAKFALVEAVALPMEAAVKNIDKNPQLFLKSSTIKNLPTNSRGYKLATQIFKLGAGLLTAIPKSMLTIAFIPLIMDKLFNVKKQKNSGVTQDYKKGNLTFTGNINNKLAKGIGKILDNKNFQNFIKKNQTNDKNIAKHMSAGTDILLTSAFALQTNRSKQIKENRKKALIYNNVISTAITLFGGYGIDRLIKDKTGKFIKKFSEINKADPKLPKYIEGINIIRPALIFAAIYYGILPIFSTYLAEKIDKYIVKNSRG